MRDQFNYLRVLFKNYSYLGAALFSQLYYTVQLRALKNNNLIFLSLRTLNNKFKLVNLHSVIGSFKIKVNTKSSDSCFPS